MYRANWVQVNGTKYQMPFAVVVGKKEDDLVFGKVENIYVDAKTVIFEFIEMLTHCFSSHYHVFVVSVPPVPVRLKYLIKQQNLIDYHPYGLYTSSHISSNPTLEYVVLRSQVYVPDS